MIGGDRLRTGRLRMIGGDRLRTDRLSGAARQGQGAVSCRRDDYRAGPGQQQPPSQVIERRLRLLR